MQKPMPELLLRRRVHVLPANRVPHVRVLQVVNRRMRRVASRVIVQVAAIGLPVRVVIVRKGIDRMVIDRMVIVHRVAGLVGIVPAEIVPAETGLAEIVVIFVPVAGIALAANVVTLLPTSKSRS